jgi:exopolysaccharide biosynthesis polyprenyl glycosylphosphotransferase
MSQAALQWRGADLEHSAASEAPTLAREARRLAEMAGQFALFGLRLDQLEAGQDEAVEIAYQPVAASAVRANTDDAARTFPSLPRRGVHIDPRLPMQIVRALDWIAVALTAELAARWGAGAGLAELNIAAAAAFLISAGCLKVGMWLTESYRGAPANARAERGLGGLTLGAILGLIAANALAPDARASAALSASLPFAAMLMAGVHAAFAVWTRAAHRKGMFAETVLLIGATDAAARLAERAAKTGDARIVAVVDDRLERAPRTIGGVVVSGDLETALAWDGLPNIDRIVITVTQKAESRVRDIIERLRVIPNRVDLLMDFETRTVRGRGFERLGGAAVACISGRPHHGRRALVKRAEDLILAAALAAVFIVPALFIAAAVKLDSRGPVFYRQRRHGFNNRVITVLKFRTMRHDPGAPFRQVCANDPRITRIGQFLRRTSLDELPQLLNVLRGDMSLVGPRPHAIGMKSEERELSHIIAEYAHRHRVKPGITGWAQVNGSRGALSCPAAVRKRVRLDLEYVSRASLWFDLQILLRTAPSLLGDNKATR